MKFQVHITVEYIDEQFGQAAILLFRYLFSNIIKNIENVYYLPASRSGLYQALSAFSQIVAELAKQRMFVNNKIELPSISEHLSDYYLYLSTISRRQINNPGRFAKIGNEIEQQLLHGKVEFDPETKQMNYTPDNTNLTLELSSTSSMVAELAPIVSYMRFIVGNQNMRKGNENTRSHKKPLIFIEEPESHLHPSIQVKLMKIFAHMVKDGIKIAITTHSNYMFNTANNLLLAGKLDPQIMSVQFMAASEHGSLAKTVAADHLGMEDENFLPETEALFEEKLQILDGINESL